MGCLAADERERRARRSDLAKGGISLRNLQPARINNLQLSVR
jgi:hypothetical protein